MKWISTKDEQPKVGKQVIVYAPAVNGNQAEIKAATLCFFDCLVYIGKRAVIDDPQMITHWMPLPEPPIDRKL